MNQGSVRVAVVARGAVARSGLAAMLEEAAHVKQTTVFRPEEFTTGSPEDAVQLLILSCDVLVLWCVNGAGEGEDAWVAGLAEVVRRNGVRVLLVLPGAEVRRAASGEVVPCDGILDQDALTSEGLDEALRKSAEGIRLAVPAGQTVAVPRSVRPARSAAGPWTRFPRRQLTERERRVLELLVEGLSNRQIGQALEVSEHVAKRTVALVLAKLDCPNRTQAAAVALREGLVGTGLGEALGA
ncbi:response regulator transcription factor [Streptomyces sp. M2CJ-2]|uniref:helix-turn-helix transcriptional regulator n=1 Tax=Streptomyces sp. M2CJ-2 TaxID=2803948 RepID=UPI0019282208|nr:LuxR C-terminal-related transcriptional regulator [Streptomyces sp. M2CJ-2]MBL3668648.1 response regulator transcription factor [Streptomyces sp. M2CJ-2]